MREAMLYEKLPDNQVRCGLCSHKCSIVEGKRGVCSVRENRSGKLHTLVYGRTIAQNVDPIEKKPLFHFQPGSKSYSIATIGCNFHCDWCQNWNISQTSQGKDFIEGSAASPRDIVVAAKETGCRSIAYTYTEPTVFFEYTFEIAKLARGASFANVYVSNGYMSKEMLDLFHPYLDAINIDLKAFRDETYRNCIGANLQAVLDSLKLVKQFDILLEVTTLIVPGINDDPAEVKDMASFIAEELGKNTPWHISRFHPMHKKFDVHSTSVKSLQIALEIGRAAGLEFVYLGNVSSHENESTFCPSCGKLVVKRMGYSTNVVGLDGSRCGFCGIDLNFVR